MNVAHVLAEVETWCAGAVERVFARAFPTSLEPVRIARKIVPAFESAALPEGATVSRITVRIHPHDMARLDADPSALERGWGEMLVRIAVRAGRADRPTVRLEASLKQARGTVAAAAEFVARRGAQAQAACALRVRKGVPLDTCFPLSGSLVIGRDAGCDVVLVDPRISRRHARVSTVGEGISFADLDSSNGLFLNGTQQANGSLHVGDVLRLGDTELLVVSYRNA
jgi:S-DNA-T family DNA segregation ATPase FtsK/SpoIIIE